MRRIVGRLHVSPESVRPCAPADRSRSVIVVALMASALCSLASGCASGEPKDPELNVIHAAPPDTAGDGGPVEIRSTPANGGGNPTVTSTPTPVSDPVVARIGGQPIRMSQVVAPLIEDQGLAVLLQLVQLELARANARQNGLAITPEDLKAERQRTLDSLFAGVEAKTREEIDDLERGGKKAEAEKLRAEMLAGRPAMLKQFLAQQQTQSGQYVSPQQFEMAIETNTYLRKIAEPQLEGKISEDALRKRFGAQYGQKAVVRHIQVSNLSEIGKVQERLRAGEAFGIVAKDLSRNRQTSELGGELPAFTIDEPNLPEVFKKATFALKPGEVSEPVQTEGSYHLIKLESLIDPKVVKFEDVKESIRRDMHEMLVQAAVKDFRNKLAQQAMDNLRIDHPVLSKQFAQRIRERDEEREKAKLARDRDLEKRQRAAATRPSTTAPAGSATPAPDEGAMDFDFETPAPLIPDAPATTVPSRAAPPPAGDPGAAAATRPSPAGG